MLDKNDKNEMRSMMVEVVGTALEGVVLPRFDNIEKDISGVKKNITGIKKDVETLKDDVSELKDTTTRIELQLNAVVKRQDDQGDDIIKIKKVLKLEPAK
jgi:septal ring factor EnvC (AmiA/AmiB activator)